MCSWHLYISEKKRRAHINSSQTPSRVEEEVGSQPSRTETISIQQYVHACSYTCSLCIERIVFTISVWVRLTTMHAGEN